MKSVSRRVSDMAMLHLIKMWPGAPVEEKDKESGRINRTTANKDKKKGTRKSDKSFTVKYLYAEVF
jgi:hypothetical protein